MKVFLVKRFWGSEELCLSAGELSDRIKQLEQGAGLIIERKG